MEVDIEGRIRFGESGGKVESIQQRSQEAEPPAERGGGQAVNYIA